MMSSATMAPITHQVTFRFDACCSRLLATLMILSYPLSLGLIISRIRSGCGFTRRVWDRTVRSGLGRADWAWSDERLGRLRQIGLTPIVGLLHHGSGPRHTSLVDPSLADGLAEFAGVVAARYPWVEQYTPVNEPLT